MPINVNDFIEKTAYSALTQAWRHVLNIKTSLVSCPFCAKDEFSAWLR